MGQKFSTDEHGWTPIALNLCLIRVYQCSSVEKITVPILLGLI
jgi:hypothetical protein